MANFNTTDKQQSAIDVLAASIERARGETGTANVIYGNKELAHQISVESAALNHAETAQLNRSMNDVARHLSSADMFGNRDVLDALGLESVNDIPAHSMKAAQIMVAASGNVRGYHASQFNVRERGKNVNELSLESLYSGPGGNLAISFDQTRSEVALESFDEKELNKFLDYSIIYNVLASQQDELNALFFRPLTVTPDEVGYRVHVRVEQVWDGNAHNPNGDPNKITKRNLIDALVHPEILEANGTEIIPFVQDNGAYVSQGQSYTGIDNTEHFALDIGKTTRALENISVTTAPLKMNMEHDILGLSSHPALIANGLMDDKDSLDSRIALSNVYLKVGDQYVKYNTSMLYSSGFYKAIEGDFRKMTLSFDNNSFLLSEAVKDVEQKPVEKFKKFVEAGYDVRLQLRAAGTALADHGHVEITAFPVKISAILKDGVSVAFDKASLNDKSNPEAGKLKQLIEELFPANGNPVISLVAYDLEARRTNYNLRTRGRMIDSTAYSEQITIPLRSPISIVKPVVGAEKEYPDVKALVVATRIQANNDGVATILNHADTMRAIISRKNYDYDTDRHAFPGIGRHFLQPCFLHEKIHLPDFINSVSSENRLKDIQGAVSTKLNEIVGRILKVTNYIPVVEQMTGGNVGKVQAIIGTDYRLPQYLVTQGDTRLFGGKIDYEIGRSPNKHMADKIVMSLSRVNSDEGPDPFSYGTFVWCPELVVTKEMHRGAATYMQHLVQPRYMHIVNIPILVLIDVTGIEEVTGEATVLVTTPVTKEEAGLPGNDTMNVTLPETSNGTTYTEKQKQAIAEKQKQAPAAPAAGQGTNQGNGGAP